MGNIGWFLLQIMGKKQKRQNPVTGFCRDGAQDTGAGDEREGDAGTFEKIQRTTEADS